MNLSWNKFYWRNRNKCLRQGISLLLAVVLACSLLQFSAPTAHASGTVLKVGYSDIDGISVDDQGDHVHYSGYAVDYLKEIAKYTDWEYEYVFDSWENCLDALERGEIDLLPMVIHTPERAERFLYSNLDVRTSYTVLYAEPSSDIYYRDYPAFDGCRIGVAAKSYFETSLYEQINSLGLECEVITFPTESAAKEALLSGEIELFAASSFASHPELKMVDRFTMLPTYIVTGKQNQELMDQINSALQWVQLEHPDLEARLSEAYRNTANVDLHFTREEREYIDSAGTINIRMFQNRRPLVYFEKDEVRGVLPDYLTSMSELTGLKFNYIQMESETALEEVPLLREDGSLLLTVSTAVAEQTDLLQSRTVMSLDLAYVKRVKDDANFKPSTFAILRNMAFLEAELADEYTVVFYDTVEECMDAVVQGDADITLQFEVVTKYLLQKPKYTENLVEWFGPEHSLNLYLYGQQDQEILLSILNKTQEYLTDAERTNLLSNALVNHTYKNQLLDTLYQYNVFVAVAALGLIGLVIAYQVRIKIRRDKQKALENEKVLSAIAQHSDRAVCLYDVNRRTAKIWSDEMCSRCVMPCLNKLSLEEMLAEKCLPDESKNALRQLFRDIENGVTVGSAKVKVCSEDGSVRWQDIMFSAMRDNNGNPLTALLSNKDITEQYERELLYRRMSESMNSDAAENLISVESDLTADRVEQLTGLILKEEDLAETRSHAELGRRIFAQNFSFMDVEAARAYFSRDGFLAAYDKGDRQQHSEWQVRYLNGSEHWLDTEVTLMEDPYTRHIKMFLRMRDITAEKLEALEIRERSERDGLTGLYNRITAEELIRSKLGDASMGIFVILDLDRLKQINDTYGHDAGDKAIVSIAQVLKAYLRDDDIVGRMGGDEFVVYLRGAASSKDVVSNGLIAALVRKIGELSVGENGEMGITCSIGCVVEENDSTYESLYKQADRALYHVKKSGRNNFAFYTPEMDNDDFIYEMDKLFSLDRAKRYETGEVKQLLTTLCEVYHLVLCCNIAENSYHLMQEVRNGIFTQLPTFGKMDLIVKLSEMRMTPEDAKRFDDAVSRQALLEAGARGDKCVTIRFDFQDYDGVYKPAECNSILYRNAKGDLCEFALIRWIR